MAWPYKWPWVTQPATGVNRGVRTCPLCKGTGLNPKLLTHVCPKCDGEKVVPK